MNIIEGQIDATDLKFAIVVSRFNEFITNKLLSGALDCLKRHNSQEKNITVVWVPGSFEIPPIAKKLSESNKYDAIICLGAVIKGGTPHFDYISAQVSKGIAQISLESKIPIIFGVLTTDTIEQAIERAGTKMGNKGFEASFSAIEMAQIYKQLS
ncbi:MAG: 6,7-dimethyl-8-ribityllumazine synthase [Spirochaetota bacterium]|nr:6,7-dimethyl-8-ribityllumazine synthase [Spirochaetota bacterium]